MIRPKLLVGSLSCLLMAVAFGQETSPYGKFGSIDARDLNRKYYSIDSGAAAVVLLDVGKFSIEGNSKGFFSVSYKRHRVVHILDKNGYGEADIAIPLYSKGNEQEKLKKIRAVTYNLERGKIVQAKVDKRSVFTEERTENWRYRKFTFPNVREGSIIEYEYEVLSDYVNNLDPWLFQGSSPVLWSELSFTVPQFFSYAFLKRGSHDFYITDAKDRTEHFSVLTNTNRTASSEKISFAAGVTEFRWVMKDVPPIKEEDFTSALKNHISSIEFQLAAVSEPLEPQTYRNTWPGLAKDLLRSDQFGARLDKENNWLGDETKPLVEGVGSELARARKIYQFVRANFYCTGQHSIYLSQDLKQVMRSRQGNVADLNLLLVAMLRYAGINAQPVILSTAAHGYALENYPMITHFNYVIARMEYGEKEIFLDASDPLLGFGKLLPQCYNGHARLVTGEAPPVYLSADSLTERKITSVFLGCRNGKWSGSVQQTPGEYESYLLRRRIKDQGSLSFFNEMEKRLGTSARIGRPGLDSLSRYEDPLLLHFDLELTWPADEIFYLDPLFGQGYRKNPFQSARRHYPVEMPFRIDETIVATVEIPDGYEVDELPRQIIARIDEEGSAYFEYRISASGSMISLRTIVRFNRTVFMPDEYENLRQFFSIIVSKHAEQVVFKKKK